MRLFNNTRAAIYRKLGQWNHRAQQSRRWKESASRIRCSNASPHDEQKLNKDSSCLGHEIQWTSVQFTLVFFTIYNTIPIQETQTNTSFSTSVAATYSNRAAQGAKLFLNLFRQLTWNLLRCVSRSSGKWKNMTKMRPYVEKKTVKNS